jgi:transposase
MAPPLLVAPHLPVEELYERYRRCSDGTEKSHWQILWLRAQGHKPQHIADVTGYRTDWIRRIVHRYNDHGPDGVGDRRRHNGSSPLLGPTAQEQLLSALMEPHPDGGLWNSPKVAQWISAHTGRRVRRQRGWAYLQRLGMTPQRPRPRHVEADERAQAEWKKNSTTSWRPSGERTPAKPSNSGARMKRDSG